MSAHIALDAPPSRRVFLIVATVLVGGAVGVALGLALIGAAVCAAERQYPEASEALCPFDPPLEPSEVMNEPR